MAMLDLSGLDLDEIATALDDHTDFGRWWIDGDTGEVWYWSLDADGDDDYDPDGRPNARPIDPLPSQFGYADMEDFIDRVPERRAADLLGRAITGRGAFRRFKDTLFEFPELREAWLRFRDSRARCRAIEFLVDEGLVDDAAARVALAAIDDPPVGDREVRPDPRDIAAVVAAELRDLYGERLVEVVLYGSQARDDAHPESDIDLAVILDDMTSSWEELRRMDELLWRHSLGSGWTIAATPIPRAVWSSAKRPLVRSARAGGVRIT
jgi:hypothetical protein